jgi:murein L,D-transpeptidase YcbB/YkuD
VDPEALDPNWNMYLDIKEKNPAHWFQSAIDMPDLYSYINKAKPELRIYTALKDGLAKYRQIKEQGGWQVIPAGETLKPGMNDNRIPLLRKRLLITDDLREKTVENPLFFDESLEEGIKRFQERHGLKPDGVVGNNTLEALNVPVEKRIEQLLINLERIRWVYRDTDPEYILVNIASFYANYAHIDTILWRARAQVGKERRKTPIFKANLEYIVINPTWTVPPTILKRDVLPAIKRDRSYLTRKNMKIVNRQGQIVNPDKIDWTSYTGSNFPYTIRQDPGPTNALGRVKYIFPNKHFVFLHDTPSKALFDRETRTFSSGCIRVQNPFKLAEALLRDEAEWSPEKINEVLKSEKTKTIYLKRPVSVFLLYATAFPSLDYSSIHFRDDVYNRDPAVLKGLQEPFKRKERHVISE